MKSKKRRARNVGGAAVYRRRLLRKSKAELIDIIIALDGGIASLQRKASAMARRIGKLSSGASAISGDTGPRSIAIGGGQKSENSCATPGAECDCSDCKWAIEHGIATAADAAVRSATVSAPNK